MGVNPKIGGVVFTPQTIHLFIGFSIIINHPFRGTPIFGNTQIKFGKLKNKSGLLECCEPPEPT